MAKQKDDMDDLPDEMTLTLRKSVDCGAGHVLHELTLREPTTGEIDQFMRKHDQEGPMAAMNLLISLVSGVDLPFVKRIGIRDAKKAGDFLANFIDDGRETGVS